MRVWYTFGAFGTTIVELSWREYVGLLFGREYYTGTSHVISLGKSKQKSFLEAPSREEQLRRKS